MLSGRHFTTVIISFSAMGLSLATMMHMLGTNKNELTCDKVRAHKQKMTSMMNNAVITARERLHINAAKQFAEG